MSICLREAFLQQTLLALLRSTQRGDRHEGDQQNALGSDASPASRLRRAKTLVFRIEQRTDIDVWSIIFSDFVEQHQCLREKFI